MKRPNGEMKDVLMKRRIELLEAALLEYVEKYGVTEKARMLFENK